MKWDVYMQKDDDRVVVVQNEFPLPLTQRLLLETTGYKVTHVGGHFRSLKELQDQGYTGRIE
jgi:hypothetical protein